MPRSNRHQSLSTRLANAPRIDLAAREPHQIVGSTEWAQVKQRIAFLEGRSTVDQITGICRNDITNARVHQNPGCSSELVDKILAFINHGEWAQIEGGEHDGRWVNPRHYPDRIFETGRVTEAKTGENT